MPWTLRKLGTVLGVVAASLLILTFLETQRLVPTVLRDAWALTGLAYADATNLLIRLNADYPVPLPPFRGLGDFVLLGVGVGLFLLLFYRPLSEAEREVQRIRVGLLDRVLGQTGLGSRTPAEASPPPPVQFSDSEFINAPRGAVWEFLSQTSCGPTCQELLDSVAVTLKKGRVIMWEGRGQVAGNKIYAEGTTKLAPPGKLEVTCQGGALKGFKGTFTLKEAEGGTQVKETAEFDPASVPSEFSLVVPKLSVLVPYILEGDLDRVRVDVEEALGSSPDDSRDFLTR